MEENPESICSTELTNGIQGRVAGSASSISFKLKPFTGYFEGQC